MASGETLLKISDFPFSYSLIALVFYAWGIDFQGSNLIIFLSISGSLGTILSIVDPLGLVIRKILKRFFENQQIKKVEQSFHDPKEYAIKAIRSRAIKIEIDKLVSLFYVAIILYASSSFVNLSESVAEKYQLIDENGNKICDIQCVQNIGHYVPFAMSLLITGVGVFNYRDVIKYTRIVSVYEKAINLDTVTRTTVENMGKALEYNDWQTAEEWSLKITNETKRQLGRKEELDMLIIIFYKPLFDECYTVSAEQETIVRNMNYSTISNGQWRTLQNHPDVHKIDDSNLISQINELYSLKEQFNNLVPYTHQRIREIMEKRGSEFYDGLDVKRIDYFFDGKNRGAPDLISCLMFGIHPKETPSFKSKKPHHINITYSNNGATEAREISASASFVDFEKLWQIMLTDVNSDEKINQMKRLYSEIKEKNKQLSQSLLKKFRYE